MTPMRKSCKALTGGRKSLLWRTDLFLTHGFAATSMSALARAVGVQKASLYHHFASKEALFIACVTEGYEAATVRKLEALRVDASAGRCRPHSRHDGGALPHQSGD